MLQPLFLDTVPSPIGRLWLVSDKGGRLHAIEWEEREAILRARLDAAAADWVDRTATEAQAIGDPLRAYFGGSFQALAMVQVEAGGTLFQQTVWKALRAIPAGKLRSYGEIARAIGRPTAFRAVGLANGANPVPIVVPCHRVIGSNGDLTGFGGGIERKRWLLRHEGAMSLQDRQSSLQY